MRIQYSDIGDRTTADLVSVGQTFLDSNDDVFYRVASGGVNVGNNDAVLAVDIKNDELVYIDNTEEVRLVSSKLVIGNEEE